MALTVGEINDEFWSVVRAITKNRENKIIEDDGLVKIQIVPTYFYIPILNINAHIAYACPKDSDADGCKIGSDLIIFYDNITKEEVFFEFGSNLAVCLYNYCQFAGIDEWQNFDKIKDIACFYVLDTDHFDGKIPVR